MVQGGKVLSGPAGVTGYIVGSPDGSFKVVVSAPAEPVGQSFLVVVEEVENLGEPVAVGLAVKRAVTPIQSFKVQVNGTDGTTVSGSPKNGIFHFTASQANAQASDFTATVALPDGSSAMVGSEGFLGPQQTTAKIVSGTNGSYQLVIHNPEAAIGQTYAVMVTGTDGSKFAAQAVNKAVFPFALTNPQATYAFTSDNPNATIDDFTALVDLGNGQSVRVGSQGVIGADGSTGKIVANPTTGFDVQFSTPATQAALTDSQAIFFTGTGPDSVASDYKAEVTLSPGEPFTVRGDRVVSGPAGVTGYIVGSSDGSFKVVVGTPQSRSARDSSSRSSRLTR